NGGTMWPATKCRGTLWIVRTPPIPADAPFIDKPLQRLQNLIHMTQLIIADVQLIEINIVGAQPPQARLTRTPDISRFRTGASNAPRLLVKNITKLGGNHNLLAPVSQNLTQNPFAVTTAIDIRGIKK